MTCPRTLALWASPALALLAACEQQWDVVAQVPRDAALTVAPCGSILFALDHSAAMTACGAGGRTRDDVARAAIATVARGYADIPMGLLVFPDTSDASDAGAGCPSNACAAGRAILPVSNDGTARLPGTLDGLAAACGGTPLSASLEAARDPALWPVGLRRSLVLILGSAATCADGDDGAGHACDALGKTECSNPSRAYDAMTTLRNTGIRAHVISLEGPGAPGCGGPAPRPTMLDRLAELGGAPARPGTARYERATDEPSLWGTLDEIAQAARGACGGASGNGLDGAGATARPGQSAASGGCAQGGAPHGGTPLALLLLAGMALWRRVRINLRR